MTAKNGRETVYIGLDLHKRYSTVCEKDARGRTLREAVIDNGEQLHEYARGLGPHCSVAVEATGNWSRRPATGTTSTRRSSRPAPG